MTDPKKKRGPKKAHAGCFKPGQSGNPGGRPKVIGHVRELAQQQTEAAIKALCEVLKDKKAAPAARVAAASALLDRGWGRPAQPIGGADELPPIRTAREMTDAELLAIAGGAAAEDVMARGADHG